MSAATLDRPHVLQPATDPAAPPLLLLHGTGDDEHGLLPLGAELSPGGALLSPRGAVLEGGANRFFRRLREGVFDEVDLRERVDELAAFVRAAVTEHDLVPGSLVAVGFSNGANTAAPRSSCSSTPAGTSSPRTTCRRCAGSSLRPVSRPYRRRMCRSIKTLRPPFTEDVGPEEC